MRSALSRVDLRRAAATLLAAAALVALVGHVALGFWSGSASNGGGDARAGAATVGAGAAPSAGEAGSANVVVTWGASSLSNGVPVDGYLVRRYDEDTGVAGTIETGCSGLITGTSCTEPDTPVGDWAYTVTPVIGAHWRGAESLRSGAVNTGPGAMTLERTLFGGPLAPLPAPVAGTVAGFAPDEELTYTLDDEVVAGTPTQAGPDGTAAFSLTIPAGTADGPHSITVQGSSAEASAGIVVDTIAPTIDVVVTPPPNAAGWNGSSPVEVGGTVDDGGGSGVASVRYTDDGSDPKTSPTAMDTAGPVSFATTTTVRFFLTDLAGNESPVFTQQLNIDTTEPLFVIDVVDVTGGAYASPPDLIAGIPGYAYYRGIDAGSLRFRLTPVDLGGSPVVAAGFSALPPDAFGFTFDSASITTPVGGPFVSTVASWVAGSTSTPAGTVTLIDAAGNTFGVTGPVRNDSTPPVDGSVDASGLVGTGGRYSTSLTLSIQLAKGTDAGSGLADGSGPSDVPARLLRASAPLTSSDGVASGTCGTYSTYVQVGADDPAAAVSDTVPDDDTCYRYRYLVSDHVGNIAVDQSPDIKVKATPTATLTPTLATLTAVSGIAAQSISGSTVYYNPALSGSFNVDTSTTSAPAGVSQVSFPAVDGFTGGGVVTSPISGSVFRGTYAWTANAGSPSPGAQSITASNNAGETATRVGAFTVAKDAAGPTGGAVDATGLGGTGGRYATSTTVSVGFTRGTDAGAGLAVAGAQLLRASAGLTAAGDGTGTCGAFGAYTLVATDPASPRSDVVPADRTCYRYRYVVTDKVGNQTTYVSPDVKVAAAAPSAPALSFSALSNVYWAGTGTVLYYRAGAASGSVRVTATSAEPASGITGYAFPTLPGGWTGTPGATGVQTYSWSAPTPTTPVGGQAVTATSGAGLTATTTFTAVPDATAPAGGSVSYTTGYNTASTVSVAFAAGTDGGSGIVAVSGLLQRAFATLAGGTCGTYGSYATIANNPSSPFSDSPPADGCYQYRYLISDNVGNEATYTSASVVKQDTTGPTGVLSLTAPVGAYLATAGPTLYYKGNASGSFRLVDTVTDAGSGAASAVFPLIATTGWVHNAETVTTPAGGPYTSTSFSWTANPAGPGVKSIAGRDVAGNVGGPVLTFLSDITAPTGGSISYTGGVVNAASVPITTVAGTDAGSGIGTTTIKRDVATLTTSTETCGTFPGTYATTVALVGGADTSVTTGSCYQYRSVVADNVGNTVTNTSATVVKLDRSGPRVTAIASKNGTNPGDGRLAIGDKLILTFNQSLATASVPATFSGATESAATSGADVTLSIPGITNGALDTGSPFYLSSRPGTATFGGTVALVNNGTATTVTVTVTSLTGATTAVSLGALVFKPATTLTDGGGNAATGTFTTSGVFQLF
jgi:hypothetical protein